MTDDERRSALLATRRLLSRGGPLREEGGQLWIEALRHQEVVRRLSTPVLVYSAARLRDNIEKAIDAAKACAYPVRVHFALKACYLVGVVALAREAGLNVEVMSEFEYLLARRIGFSPDQVVVNGPAKRPEFLERAVTEGVCLINVESLSEIAFLDSLGLRRGKPIEVGLRINPLLSRRLRGPFAPPGSKFGFDVASAEAAAAVKRIIRSRSLVLRAVHCHSYTRQYTPDAHRAHVAAVVKFVRQVEGELGVHIPVLDLGGGFGSRYLMESYGQTLRHFIDRMTEPLAGLQGHREIIIEPGRYLVNDAAICLTSVLACKRNSGRPWVVVDAGRSILPSRENAEYVVIPSEARRGRIRYSVGDFLCMPSERHPLSLVSGAIEPGDVLTVFNSGAYTFSLAQSFGELIP
ncbi:MAG: diaminopimelate decarboxylase family protein, partial [Candidatus Methylomirabilis sp.]